jgi:phage terminase Nu1 subunit (DNA packaging protein)
MTDDEITAIVERFPLPEGVPDVVLNKRELAEFLATSTTTLDVWVRDGLPARVEGTNGREWEFQASAAWAWKCAREEGERIKSTEAQAAIEKMRLALVGGKAGNSMQALPPKERQQLYDVEAAYEKLRRERNQTLDRDEVQAVMNDLMRIVRNGLSMLPDNLERKLGLDGKGVEAAQEQCDDTLTELDMAISKFFSDRQVITREARTDLFN